MKFWAVCSTWKITWTKIEFSTENSGMVTLKKFRRVITLQPVNEHHRNFLCYWLALCSYEIVWMVENAIEGSNGQWGNMPCNVIWSDVPKDAVPNNDHLKVIPVKIWYIKLTAVKTDIEERTEGKRFQYFVSVRNTSNLHVYIFHLLLHFRFRHLFSILGEFQRCFYGIK